MYNIVKIVDGAAGEDILNFINTKKNTHIYNNPMKIKLIKTILRQKVSLLFLLSTYNCKFYILYWVVDTVDHVVLVLSDIIIISRYRTK